ncbi:putative Undecaprenyl-phosphate glucose phosphotransferase, WcaJ [Bradyrhizobium sp. ORS 285]|uniref:undecaprenyl-phosphate glucose phosphotransferase n=1 Tax=Bradyrhizobium sp. ORS 285 TaxID=115808 RepID=UPI0002408943|nr:undecaprenyl-phosphate glucose phosphotransferase [Bradyrhizobium sp. ORS 285]CCD84523.1 putative Bacterial sugar transferase family protein [Bradyrhizobium sp. ORS 285]SMX57504.1 putative Undecaprenyl-phosphate glucose phosphotransferase, WcaJ [Bradyrhizobium sp. ORS 285]
MHYVDQPEALDRNGMPTALLAERQVQARKWPVHYAAVEPFAIATDIATITTSSVLSGFLYHLQDAAGANDVSKSVGLAILVSALFVSLMKIRGMYRPAELLILPRQVRATCLTWVTAFLVLAGALFALKIGSEFSRGTSVVFAMLGLSALILNRRVTEYLLVKGLAEKRFSGRNIVLITDEDSKDNAGLTQLLTDTGFRVKRHFLLPEPGAGPDQRQRIVASVIDYVRGSDIEEIVVGANPDPWSDLRTLGAELRVLPFPVSFVPVGTASEMFKRPRRELGSAVCIELHRGLMSPVEHATKRLMDVLLAGLALTLLSPLLVLVAIAIRLDSPGPALFRQQRCGFNGRAFQIFKFRTMSVLEDGPSVVQAKLGDSRFTRIGAWLRRTSIDELPQLLNVLNGSMSLVGPRPHALAHDNEFDKLVRNYAFRRRVKPGLTGWAQVHGCRGPTPTRASIEQRVEFDLWYIDNWSLSLDIAILLRTPLELIRGNNAY